MRKRHRASPSPLTVRARNNAVVWSDRINRLVEAVVAILMLCLVLDVWLGVADRYYFGWQLEWPETLARYLMIWTALLAVSCGIARREHIALTGVITRLPDRLKRTILILTDLLALALFICLAWYGTWFAVSGLKREALIFGANMAPFYAAVPAAAILASLQMLLVVLRDLGTQFDGPANSEGLT